MALAPTLALIYNVKGNRTCKLPYTTRQHRHKILSKMCHSGSCSIWHGYIRGQSHSKCNSSCQSDDNKASTVEAALTPPVVTTTCSKISKYLEAAGSYQQYRQSIFNLPLFHNPQEPVRQLLHLCCEPLLITLAAMQIRRMS